MEKNIDWSNLGFGYMKTDYRYVSNFKDGKSYICFPVLFAEPDYTFLYDPQNLSIEILERSVTGVILQLRSNQPVKTIRWTAKGFCWSTGFKFLGRETLRQLMSSIETYASMIMIFNSKYLRIQFRLVYYLKFMLRFCYYELWRCEIHF